MVSVSSPDHIIQNLSAAMSKVAVSFCLIRCFRPDSKADKHVSGAVTSCTGDLVFNIKIASLNS